jgi:cysteine desulfurase family protein
MENHIYLDNAATSFPKPGECLKKALDLYLDLGASPGRGGYDRAVKAEMAVSKIRREIIRFFGAGKNHQVCFSNNATDALNTLLQGMSREPCHVVSTCLEHNSVLRPLHHLRARGRITFDLVPFDRKGFVNSADIAAAIRKDTRFVIMTHASNVLGTVQPVSEIGSLCREKGVYFFLDASQSAGMIPIDMDAWNVSGLAFTGHKSLLAPTGIGGLVIDSGLPIQPTTFGGTGIDSDDLFQPAMHPYRLEAGTINLFGILALGETMAYLENLGEDTVRMKNSLFSELKNGLSRIRGIECFGPETGERQLPLVSFTVQGHKAGDVAAILDGDFGIEVRSGLQCAPLVHRGIGTFPRGTVRISLGIYNRMEDIDAVLNALSAITGQRG